MDSSQISERAVTPRSVNTRDPQTLERYVIEFRKDVDSRIKDFSEQLNSTQKRLNSVQTKSDVAILGLTFLTGLVIGMLLSKLD